MSDNFEFNLHSPLTQEDWNKITDAEYENTTSVTIQTPQGRRVRYVRLDVLDKIRTEIEQVAEEESKFDKKWAQGLKYTLKIIDKYKTESEG